MSKKSYAKFHIVRIMNWNNLNNYYYKVKDKDEYKFKELKKFFAMYLGLIKDGRKKDALRDC